MNRYRQEREHTPDKAEAMKRAWTNAFSSIASSSTTTVLGLLAMVFMSLKIGADLGFVLAKGVLLCALALLVLQKFFHDAPFMRHSRALPYFNALMEQVRTWLPPDLVSRLGI